MENIWDNGMNSLEIADPKGVRYFSLNSFQYLFRLLTKISDMFIVSMGGILRKTTPYIWNWRL